MILLTLGIILSAIGGLILSYHIAHNKHSEEHMVCPVNGNCHVIVNSRFSNFFGLPVERMGMFYYAVIIILYFTSIFRDLPNEVLLIGLLFSGIGFAFSMYLTIIQLFVVKKWCTLCLFSGSLSFIIIILAFLGYEYNFIEFAYTYRDLLKWLYILGVLAGTIITTLHTRIFVNFLKDFKISRKEERRLEMFSHTAWVAIGLTFLTGLGLVLTDRWREYTDSNAFIVMVVIIGVLIVYEVVVNMIVSPKLIGMHFGDEPELEDHEHSMYRKMAFGMIAAGIVSWYSLLLLSVFNWFEYSSGQLFVGYIILIILAVAVTMYVELMIGRKAERISHEEEQEKNDI